jgi:hypothetical protein
VSVITGALVAAELDAGRSASASKRKEPECAHGSGRRRICMSPVSAAIMRRLHGVGITGHSPSFGKPNAKSNALELM